MAAAASGPTAMAALPSRGSCMRAWRCLGVSSCFNCQLMAATARPCLPTLPAAAMVGDSWMGKHFEVVGDRSTHYGKFAR